MLKMKFSERKAKIIHDIDHLLQKHFEETTRGIDLINRKEKRLKKKQNKNLPLKMRKDPNTRNFIKILNKMTRRIGFHIS